MVAVADVVEALGSGLLRTLVALPGRQSPTSSSPRRPTGRRTGVTTSWSVPASPTRPAPSTWSSRRLLPRPWASSSAAARPARGVRAAAKRAGVALLELSDSASLVHVVGVVQEIVDRAGASDTAQADPGGGADLLALADAAATLVDGPVTIEDAQSRVLAYSTRQDITDTARVSTVLGRRVPAPVVAYMRRGCLPPAGPIGRTVPRPPRAGPGHAALRRPGPGRWRSGSGRSGR